MEAMDKKGNILKGVLCHGSYVQMINYFCLSDIHVGRLVAKLSTSNGIVLLLLRNKQLKRWTTKDRIESRRCDVLSVVCVVNDSG